MHPDLSPILTCVAAWDAMPPDTQRCIGMAAIASLYTRDGCPRLHVFAGILAGLEHTGAGMIALTEAAGLEPRPPQVSFPAAASLTAPR